MNVKNYLFCVVFGWWISVSPELYATPIQKIDAFRLPLPQKDFTPKLEDLNGDGKPDVIYSITNDSIPVLWIDDNHNMKWSDIEGDMISDCLLIDRNKDGFYGGQGDLIIDWVDTNNDGIADVQIVMEYSPKRTGEVWPNGHVMIVLDTDKDNIFNYIDWDTFQIRSWDKSGICDFYMDYSGQSAFMKMHVSSYDMKDLRLNWENPFLFFDPDKDGLSEMAVRLVDSPSMKDKNAGGNSFVNLQVEGVIDWVSIAVDLDNDNSQGNEFDFDCTLQFRGDGFNYMDQVHPIKNVSGLSETDKFFLDPRWRHLSELIYPDHKNAFDLIFNRGKWNTVYFVFDEDDDCHRWERVEFYEPLDPFKAGAGKKGIDNNTQADASGDRGEWDMDNSGKGKLYVGRFDGRIHLYGAEWGCWRIDQNSEYYQGSDRLWINKDPKSFATVKYSDMDKNGFIDLIEYDIDGDTTFETVYDLKKMGIDDKCDLIDVSGFKYNDYHKMFSFVSENMWKNADNILAVARKYNVETSWYAKWKQALSDSERYHKGYWLQYYVYQDIRNKFIREKNEVLLKKLTIAYCCGDWKSLLK